MLNGMRSGVQLELSSRHFPEDNDRKCLRKISANMDNKSKYSETRLFEAYGFVLCEKFEDFLKQISEEFLERAYEKLRSRTATVDADLSDLQYGWLHPGLAHLDCEMNPVSYFGWITGNTYAHESQAEKNVADHIAALSKESPKIAWGASHRAYKLAISPTDHASALRACVEYSVSEVSIWSPRYLLEESSPTGLWKDLLIAQRDTDQAKMDELLDQAKDHYTTIGLEILSNGLELWRKRGHHPDKSV